MIGTRGSVVAAVGRRAAQMLIALWLAYTLSFILFQLLPSDPVQIMVGSENPVSDTDREALRHRLGLDQPLIVRYLNGLWAAIGGNLGVSYRSGRPVTQMILDAAGPTLQLATLALAIAVPLALACAVGVAFTRRSHVRELLLGLPPLVQSFPTFWIGLLLLQAFAFGIKVFPAGGSATLSAAVLPAVTLALPAAALLAQTLAVRLVHENGEPYAIAAASRGYRPWRVLIRHTLRNAAAPALSMAGMLVGWLLGGAVVVETVFARDGLGQLVQHAVSLQDLPVLQGVVIVSALIFLFVSACVDLLQRWLDPRLRVMNAATTTTVAA